MARPALDLPDPINDTPPPASAAGAKTSADDLLAQLAGEEIDRLLNEADDGFPTSTATPAPTTPAPAPRPQPQNIDRPIPAKPAPAAPRKPDPAPKLAAAPEAPATPTPAPTPAPSAIATDDAILAATEEALDDLFKELDDESSAAAPAPAPFSTAANAAPTPAQAQATPTPAPAQPKSPATPQSRAAAAVLADPPAPAAAQPASAADALAAELAADEAAHAAALQRMKAAPPAGAIVTTPKPAAPANLPAPIEIDPDVIDVEPQTQADTHDADLAPTEVDESQIVYPRVPLIVRILEIVNAPLASLPPTAREALGKIALVTTLNAIAVLTYVLLFRRPH